MENTEKKIAIIMATFNGVKFIAEQIESLIQQTFKNWVLYIRDDCSSDETVEILEKYSKKDQRIKIIKDNHGRLRACQNFSTAMLSVNADDYDYFMFCDQDDRWRNDKIELSIEALQNLEKKHGDDFLFAYGTLQMTNAKGVPLKIAPPDFSSAPTLGKIVAQNYIYGCTLAINRKLFKEIGVIPKTAENHDYWIALVAMFNNAKSLYMNDPMVYYRQHDSNVSGSYKDAGFLNRLNRILNNSAEKIIENRKMMLQSLILKYSNCYIDSNYIFLKKYCDFLNSGGVGNFIYMYSNGVRNFRFLSNIKYSCLMLKILINKGLK